MVGLSSCLMPLTGSHYERSSRTTSITKIRFPRSCCRTAEPALPFLQTQILDLVALNSSAAMGMIWQDFESAVVRMHHRRGRPSLLTESIQRHLGGQKRLWLDSEPSDDDGL
ncbi:hypothetical protein ACQJBY_040367 [Aegilops geniculata]